MTCAVLILYSIILLDLTCAIWMPTHICSQIYYQISFSGLHHLKNIMFTADLSYTARLYFLQEGNMSLLLSTSFVFPLCLLLDWHKNSPIFKIFPCECLK